MPSCSDRSTGAPSACSNSEYGRAKSSSFQLPNWIEWIVVPYPATRIGAISNPLILIYRERELGFMVGLARSTGLVVPSEFRASITPE